MAAGGAPMVKVYYGKPMLPDVSRVLACLYEKEVDFRLVDMYEGQHVSMDFLRLQVAARLPVPCLEDGSTPMFESRAICRYLVERYPDCRSKYLLGRDLIERASIKQWLKTEEHSFDPPSWALIFHLAFPPTASLPEPDRALATHNEKRLAKVLDVYEQMLGETNYLAGNEFSLADLSHLSNSHFLARSEEWGNLFDSRKNVRKWWSKISNRPSWKEVVKILDKIGILKRTLPASAESALQSFSKPTPSSPVVQLMPSAPAESALQSFSKPTPSSPGVQPIILGHIPGYEHTASTAPSPETMPNFQSDTITQPLSPHPVEEPATETSQKTLLPSTGQSSRPPPLTSPTTQPAKLVSVQPILPQPTTTQLPSTGQPPLVTPETTQPTMPASVQPIPSLAATTQPTQPVFASQPAQKPANANQQTQAVSDQRITPLATPITQSTLPSEPNAKQSPPPDKTPQSTARPVPTSQPIPQPTTTTNELSPPTGQNTQLTTQQNPPFSEPYSLKMPSHKQDAKSTPPAQHTLEQASANTQAVPQPEPTYPSAAQHGHQAGLTAATAEPTAPEISSKKFDPNARQTTKPEVIPNAPAEKIDTNTKPEVIPNAPTAETTASTIARWKNEMNFGATTQPGLTAPAQYTPHKNVPDTRSIPQSATPTTKSSTSPEPTVPPNPSTPQSDTYKAQADPHTKQISQRNATASNTQPEQTAPTGQTTSASAQPTFDPAAPETRSTLPPVIRNTKPRTTTDSAPASLSTPQTDTSFSQPDPQTKKVNQTDSSSNTSRPETDINIKKTTTLPGQTAPNAPQTNSANAHPDPQTKQATTTSNIPHPETDVNSRDTTIQPAETAPNTQTTSASGKPAGTDVNSRDITTQPAESAPNTQTSASAKPAETYVNSRGSTTQPAKTAPNKQSTASAKPTLVASAPDKRSDLHPVTTNAQSSATAASTVPTAPSTPQRDTPIAQTDMQTKQASQPNSTAQFNTQTTASTTPPSTPPNSVDE